MKKRIDALDLRIISFVRTNYVTLARISLFIVFFWFGALKIFGLSPASPLAEALTAQTIGTSYFDVAFFVLSLVECIIGILFLIPKATRVVIPLLLVHMVLVSSPLLLVPNLVWIGPFVPTLEGQYIIKNVALVALAIAIAARLKPLSSRS